MFFFLSNKFSKSLKAFLYIVLKLTNIQYIYLTDHWDMCLLKCNSINEICQKVKVHMLGCDLFVENCFVNDTRQQNPRIERRCLFNETFVVQFRCKLVFTDLVKHKVVSSKVVAAYVLAPNTFDQI